MPRRNVQLIRKVREAVVHRAALEQRCRSVCNTL